MQLVKYLFFFLLIGCTAAKKTDNLSSPSTQAGPKPNIVMITVDDLTAKYLGFFGAGFAHTPNIDMLAKGGVVFDNAICQGTMCGPSRNSIIAGLYPHQMGFYENGQLPALPKDVWAFPQELQKSGYYTAWIGKNHIRANDEGITGKTGVERRDKALKKMGFDHVFQSLGRTMVLRNAKDFEKTGEWKHGKDIYADYLYDHGLMEKFVKEGKKNAPSTLDPDKEYMDGYFTHLSIEKMKEYKENKPMFLWVNYSSPHEPFDVPQEYHDMFLESKMPMPIKDAHSDIPAELRPHEVKMTDREILNQRAAYSACISYIDHQVGRIINYLKDAGKMDNTIIVFYSDHGIMTGDHALEHKSTLYKEVLNPSLIFYYPKAYKPKRINKVVEMIDLGKTMTHIAAGGDDNSVSHIGNGNSLVPLLTGKGTFMGSGLAFSYIDGFVSVYDGRYKYIGNDKTSILFDLKSNPDETINYAKTNPEKVEELKNHYDKLIKRTGQPLPPKNKKSNDSED
jgi:arylsulfatase A-like enzyme